MQPAMLENMRERVFVCAKDEVELFSDHGITHLLSIENRGVEKDTPTWFGGQHLQICFSDIETRDLAEGDEQVAASRDQVSEILAFGASAFESSENRLLIHCLAGVSRSTAAALGIISQELGENSEADSLEILMSIRPMAFPNILVVQLADRLLCRGGKLEESLKPMRDAGHYPAEGKAWLARWLGL